jgi:hypothetical protein
MKAVFPALILLQRVASGKLASTGYTVVKHYTSEEEINSQLRELTAEVRRLRHEFLDRSRPRPWRERLIGRSEPPPPDSSRPRET